MDLAASEEGRLRPAPEVSPRNFSTPRRLSPEELRAVHTKTHRALAPVANHFMSSMRATYELEIESVSEVNASNLFPGLQAPFAIVKFDVRGQPGWLAWEVPAALAAAEILLGAQAPSEQAERPFSALERRSLERLLTPLVLAMGEALGVQTQNIQVLHSIEDLGHWSDCGDHSEPGRLHLSLAFAGPGGPSTFNLYVPGIEPHSSNASVNRPASALPGHLDNVTVDLSARLGSNFIPLADLLSIEVGDVIPLGAPIDEPLRIFVEDVPQHCGRGYLGSHQGNLAIRLEEIGLKDEEN